MGKNRLESSKERVNSVNEKHVYVTSGILGEIFREKTKPPALEAISAGNVRAKKRKARFPRTKRRKRAFVFADLRIS